MNDNADYLYCREKIAPDGSNLYYATLFTEHEKKRFLIPLLCFEGEIIHILETCQDPGVARMKLQWWREEINRVFNGQARHPLSHSLLTLVAKYQFDVSLFLNHIQCIENLIYIEQADTLETCFDLFIDGPGLIWRSSATISGHNDPDTLNALEQLGVINALLTLFKHPGYHIQHNRILIPREFLVPASYTLQDCLGNDEKALRQIFTPLFLSLEQQLKTVYTMLPAADRQQQLHALILSQLLAQQCHLTTRHCHSLFKERRTVSPLKKLVIAWLTKRKVKNQS